MSGRVAPSSPDPFGDDFPSDAAFLDAVASLVDRPSSGSASVLPSSAASTTGAQEIGPQAELSQQQHPIGPTAAAARRPVRLQHVDIEIASGSGHDDATRSSAPGGNVGTAKAGEVVATTQPDDDMDVEELIAIGTGGNPEQPPPSLYQLFRSRRAYFSVTDLSAPSWCEVQFDYGLRGQRYLPVEQRPPTFLSARGQIITLNVEQASVNAKIMDAGSAVHKKLEREIHPVEVQVDVTTREERWGLRLLNMLASLEALLQLGICREMPVAGFIKGHYVVGIVDEIQRRPLPSPAALDPPLSRLKASVSVPQPAPSLSTSVASVSRIPDVDLQVSQAIAPAATVFPQSPSTPTRSSPRKRPSPAELPFKGSRCFQKAASAAPTSPSDQPLKGARRATPHKRTGSAQKRADSPPRSAAKATKITNFFRPRETGLIVLADDGSDVDLAPPSQLPSVKTAESPSKVDSSSEPPAPQGSSSSDTARQLDSPAWAAPDTPIHSPDKLAASGAHSSPARPAPTHALFVSDSKTRRSLSLPRDDASLAGKIQVQIYKLLLDDLLAPSASPMPTLAGLPTEPSTSVLARLFAHLGLDPDARFSDGFRTQAQDLIDGNSIAVDWSGGRALTLGLLAECWAATVDQLGIDRDKGVDEQLQLVYRYQSPVKKSAGAGSKRKGKRKAKPGAGEALPPATEADEDERLELAIQASVAEQGGNSGPVEPDAEASTSANPAPASTSAALGSEEPADDQELQLAIQLSLAAVYSGHSEPLSPTTTAPLEATLSPSAKPARSSLQSPRRSQPGTARAVQAGSTVEPIDDGPVEVAEGAFDPPPPPLHLGSQERPSYPELLSTSSSIIIVDDMLRTDRPPSALPLPAPTKAEQVEELMRLYKLSELRVLARKEGLPIWGAKNVLADRIFKARRERALVARQAGLPSSSLSQSSPPEKRTKTVQKANAASPGPASLPSNVARPIALSRSQDDDVIGVKTFRHSPGDLDVHLSRVFDFWLGRRPPIGVPENETWKCNSCELRESCEWREEEAWRIWDRRTRARGGKG